jgi:signal peptidase I
MACMLFWSLLLYGVFHRYVVGVGTVTDTSMVPTLVEGNYFLINKYVYHLSRPRLGDIVVFRPHPQAEERYVKRVIGSEGQMLTIRSGQVYIDGERLSEPYAIGQTYPDLGPIRIQPGRYFVMGDNRLKSEDSRHFGSVLLQDIDGSIRPGHLFDFF